MSSKVAILTAALAAGAAVAPLPGVAQEEQTTPAEAGGEKSMTAQVAACYVGQNLEDPDQQACAQLCLAKSAPLVLIADDGTPYVPFTASGGDVSDKLMKYTAAKVQVSGTVGEESGCRTIAVAKVDKLKEQTRGSGRAFSATLITERDLEPLGDMSVYDLLRQHSSIRMDRSGGVEIIYCEERTAVMQYRGCPVFVNDARVPDPVATVREMRVSEVSRLEILRANDAAARYGAHTFTGAIAISKKR